ncbi:MAG: hypothetical protein ABIG42_11505 [bacterium]
MQTGSPQHNGRVLHNGSVLHTGGVLRTSSLHPGARSSRRHRAMDTLLTIENPDP